MRHVLALAQVAGSVLVLFIAGMFVHTFQAAQGTDPGFDADRLLTVNVDLRSLKYSETRTAEFVGQLRRRAGDIPGVVSASLADVVPLGNTRVVNVRGLGEIATATVDSRYFRTMGIPILRGREPMPNEPDAVVVNDAFAHSVWPGRNPVGQTIRLASDKALRQVVGVTRTGKYWSLDEAPRPFLYRMGESSGPLAVLLLRLQSPGLGQSVGRAVRRAAPEIPGAAILTADERLRAWLEPRRAAAGLLSVLGLMALGLAVTGLYGLLAQLAIQRAPELAVRLALGASRAAVTGLLVRQSGLLILGGTGGGIVAGWILTRILGSVAGHGAPLDAATLLAVAALPVIMGAAATVLPAYRAARVDPVTALRNE